ncbi:Uncharacterised protein [Acinetobacter baumannii]|uniref:hypothetical protein n=1 Tax=Providencia sp. PROV261 TaxID=2949949 RepID=UPI000DE728E3|nr:hypothetical protein [Providencia sp. PROV261]SST04097.1 Uncharacterised protein [Acinetobacter baumannii]
MEKTTTSHDPALAGVFSFIITGAGQLYNGEIAKGLGLFIAAVICIFIFFPLAFIPWIFSIFDAFNTAKLLNQQFIETENSKNTVDVSIVVSQFKKLSALFDADMITQEELDSKKKELIYEISLTTLKMDSLEFLAELAPLKQKGILTDDDITNIKKVI